MPADGYDFEVVMAFFSPVIDSSMPKIMEHKPVYSGFLADCFMGYSNFMGGDGLPIPRKGGFSRSGPWN